LNPPQTHLPFDVNLPDNLSLRLYGDCRPRCLETAPLQKGFVLLADGEELVEEGMGFGVPVVKYADKTLFSHTAHVKTQPDGSVTKEFMLDTVSRKKLGRAYIDEDFYDSVRELFAAKYLKHKRVSPLFNWVMETRQLLMVRTQFVTEPSRGKISVNYKWTPNTIKVDVDFLELKLRGCQELLILNEQGASFFANYNDTEGAKLVGSMIGAWDAVAAAEASMLNSKVSFTLQSVGGATLFRGWERTKNRFSWAGLSYSMSPRSGKFSYAIKLQPQSKS
jgi:hypothetical protein